MAALLNFLKLKTNIAAKSSTEQHAEGTEIGAKVGYVIVITMQFRYRCSGCKHGA